MERQKFRLSSMVMSMVFILCSIFSMLALCPIKAYAAGGVTVETDANGATCVFANGNPLTLKASPSDANKTLIYLNSDPSNPIALTGPTGDTTDGYDLSTVYIYGGSHTLGIVGNTSITMQGGKVASVYGGGLQGTVTGSTAVNISGGTVTTSVYGGGSESAATVTGSTIVTVSGETVARSVYGGGRYGNVNGSTTVNTSDRAMVNNVFGSGLYGTVGSTRVNISGGTVNGSVFGSVFGGGSENGSTVTGSTEVTITGGTIMTNVYGGGLNGKVAGTAVVKVGTEASIAGAVTGSGRNASATVDGGSHVEYEVAFYDGAAKLFAPTLTWAPKDGKATTPASPVKAGKIFTGWKNTVDDDSDYDFAANVTAPLKLYAAWVNAPTYAISYDGNGSTSGTVPADTNTYATGTAVTLAGNTGNLIKTGYTFAGWSTSATGSAITTHTMGAAPMTFYAVWTAVPANNPTNNDNNTGSSPTSTTSRAPSLQTGTGTSQTISGALEAAASGSTVEVNMNDSTMLQADWLKAIAGRDVNLVLDMGNGIKWTINGKSVTGTSFSSVNLEVSSSTSTIPGSVLNNLTGERKSIQFTVTHSGNFGFTATLSVGLGKENKGLYANLYHYNETTKKMEFQSACRIGEDGSAAWDLKHTSSYAVVIDKVSLAGTELSAGASAQDNAAASDTSHRQWGFAALVVILSAVFLLVLFGNKKYKVR